ncbi:hypothetical protein OIU85_027057 [Salix viminalis]|uniref:Uncharacterized protein n=1 Tax=Salix viminalis TaxID=40686 RepID=A0A9Q0YZK8_SALVM|nr:hypothetical protein OIU85_027057 [Salix viminalis]
MFNYDINYQPIYRKLHLDRIDHEKFPAGDEFVPMFMKFLLRAFNKKAHGKADCDVLGYKDVSREAIFHGVERQPWQDGKNIEHENQNDMLLVEHRSPALIYNQAWIVVKAVAPESSSAEFCPKLV